MLPGGDFIEKVMYHFLQSLSDEDYFWTSVARYYSKTICFKGVVVPDENNEKKFYKGWFNGQTNHIQKPFGKSNSRLFARWVESNIEDCRDFCLECLEALKITGHSHIQRNYDKFIDTIRNKYKTPVL